MRLGNSLRRPEKSEDGDISVEASIQSIITGIAAGGTRRKLLQIEATIVSILEFWASYTVILELKPYNKNTKRVLEKKCNLK